MPANEVDFRDDDRRDGFDLVLTLTREQARRPAGAILPDRREGRSDEAAPRVADVFDPWAQRSRIKPVGSKWLSGIEK
ncbi:MULTISPECIES: hypothetical protein [unclassified Mesorhizobium]|uniref:hypothetical protein n=1 Tax=unclassified Mesorhizobium TaxID=325217 RepID=UPI002417BCFA|nr:MULTISPECIES: hypothetical protein [unclassified Mesorhizobium]MDG4899523.1 hypothetical protein [Mesorhizobium sp. WSM4962]MDG4918240.1 hypothetical protein [Mesorhizobium sp. WSM4989]